MLARRKSVWTVFGIMLSVVTGRLRMFLPQLQTANTFLDQTKNIEDVDDDEEHVEMVFRPDHEV